MPRASMMASTGYSQMSMSKVNSLSISFVTPGPCYFIQLPMSLSNISVKVVEGLLLLHRSYVDVHKNQSPAGWSVALGDSCNGLNHLLVMDKILKNKHMCMNLVNGIACHVSLLT